MSIQLDSAESIKERLLYHKMDYFVEKTELHEKLGDRLMTREEIVAELDAAIDTHCQGLPPFM